MRTDLLMRIALFFVAFALVAAAPVYKPKPGDFDEPITKDDVKASPGAPDCPSPPPGGAKPRGLFGLFNSDSWGLAACDYPKHP